MPVIKGSIIPVANRPTIHVAKGPTRFQSGTVFTDSVSKEVQHTFIRKESIELMVSQVVVPMNGLMKRTFNNRRKQLDTKSY